MSIIYAEPCSCSICSNDTCEHTEYTDVANVHYKLCTNCSKYYCEFFIILTFAEISEYFTVHEAAYMAWDYGSYIDNIDYKEGDEFEEFEELTQNYHTIYNKLANSLRISWITACVALINVA